MISLRAQKKRATARSLAGAAYELATTHGFDTVTTDEIASTAGVSRRTFANYYTNKHAAVVDGFIQRLGVPTWRPDDPVDPSAFPETFNALIDAVQEWICAVFTSSERIVQIQQFAQMVKAHPTLEPYIHAVFLEFQYSRSYDLLAERFSPVRVSIFLGAVIGSLNGIAKLILGPLAIPDDTPPLRGASAPDGSVSSIAHDGDASTPAVAPSLTAADISEILTHIDHAFTYLRDGFADRT